MLVTRPYPYGFDVPDHHPCVLFSVDPFGPSPAPMMSLAREQGWQLPHTLLDAPNMAFSPSN